MIITVNIKLRIHSPHRLSERRLGLGKSYSTFCLYVCELANFLRTTTPAGSWGRGSPPIDFDSIVAMRLDRGWIKLSIPHTKTSIADKRKSNATTPSGTGCSLPSILFWLRARVASDDAHMRMQGVVWCGVDMTWIFYCTRTNWMHHHHPTPEITLKPRHRSRPASELERHSSQT